MRKNLPSFSKEAMQLSSIIPLELHEFEINQDESPIITSAQQISPLVAEPLSTNPLRYSPPAQLVTVADTLIHAADKVLTPVKSPEVEYLGVRRPSPEVEYLGVRRPEVEYLGTRKPTFFKGGSRKKNKNKKKSRKLMTYR